LNPDQKRPIGISVMSFISPSTVLPLIGSRFLRDAMDPFLERVGEILEETDLGIHLLPLRGIREENIAFFNVMSFKSPRNYGSLRQVYRREVREYWGLPSEGLPSLLDWSMFGTEKECREKLKLMYDLFPKAIPIDIPWLKDSAIELSPDMYLENPRRWEALSPSGVALDTGHWQEFSPGMAEKELVKLGGWEAVRIFHLKLRDSEQIRWFLDRKTEDMNTIYLRSFLKHDYRHRIPVIIETRWRNLVRYGQSLHQSEMGVIKAIKIRIEDLEKQIYNP
jgi:hypothetical protein